MLYYPPLYNGLQKQLASQLDQGITSQMTINNTTGLQNKPGICVVDRIDTAGKEKSTSVREYIAYSGVSGNNLTGLTRGLGGSTDQDHLVGAVVEFIPDVTLFQALNDTITAEHNSDGTHTSAIVTTLKATGTEINTGTEDAKIVTPKAIKDANLPYEGRATGSDINTGTNETKYVSPKAIKDAALPYKGKATGTEINTGTEEDKYVTPKAIADSYLGSVGSGGWNPANETWTYVSSSCFEITGNYKSVYQKGTRIKLTNGGSTKYFFVKSVFYSSSANKTKVYLDGNKRYSLSSGTITQTYYSYTLNPKEYIYSFGQEVLRNAAAGYIVNNWTTRTSAADNSWITVCWSPELSLFVAVADTGTGNRIMTSPNGITWTTRTSPVDNNWVSVCWSPELSLFVAVAFSGTGNRVMTSPDGINWTTRTSPVDNNWRSVCWSPELSLFVAVAYSGTGNRIMTSPDGINWTVRTSPADNSWVSVCWSSELSLFVAVAQSGTGNRVMTSPDGINWTLRTSAADNNWVSVCWSPELSLFVAVAFSGTGNRVMTTPRLIK